MQIPFFAHIFYVGTAPLQTFLYTTYQILLIFFPPLIQFMPRTTCLNTVLATWKKARGKIITRKTLRKKTHIWSNLAVNQGDHFTFNPFLRARSPSNGPLLLSRWLVIRWFFHVYTVIHGHTHTATWTSCWVSLLFSLRCPIFRPQNDINLKLCVLCQPHRLLQVGHPPTKQLSVSTSECKCPNYSDHVTHTCM